MNILLYVNYKTQKTVEKSGVGRAVLHQMRALELNGVKTVSKLEEADAVHINTVFPDAYFMGKKVRRKGVPLVYHAHSTREDFKNSYIGSNLVSGLFKYWIKKCYSLGDVIVTPTEYSKRLLKGYGIKKPIFAVSNGIDLGDYVRDEAAGREFRKKYGIGENEKVICSAGLLIKRKGVDDFVRLAERMPEYKFIWFGSANMKLVGSEIRNAVNKMLPNLIFAGYVSKPELQQALSGSDLFLFPSNEETEGIVVLEALALKTPVLVRDIPVYEDWLADGVNSYKAKDLDEFEEKARGILEKKLPGLREAGYEVAKSKSLDKTGARLLVVYKKAAALKRGRLPAAKERPRKKVMN